MMFTAPAESRGVEDGQELADVVLFPAEAEHQSRAITKAVERQIRGPGHTPSLSSPVVQHRTVMVSSLAPWLLRQLQSLPQRRRRRREPAVAATTRVRAKARLKRIVEVVLVAVESGLR